MSLRHQICLILFGLFFFVQLTNAQEKSDRWESFYNKDSTAVGFKDQNGQIRLDSIYLPYLTVARSFESIMTIGKADGDIWDGYFLTKSGNIVGHDSIYFFDNTPDCENEGFIRFRDKKSDKVGIFNSRGEIQIPAEYDGLTKVRNGLIIGLKGAKKRYLKDNQGNQTDEHYVWEAGQEVLIDTLNQVLVERFPYNDDLNYYSVSISEEPSADPTRNSFKGVNGKYYSFINYELELEQQIATLLSTGLSPEKLASFCFEEVTYSDDKLGWIALPKEEFVHRFYQAVQKELQKLTANRDQCFFTLDGLNPFIFESALYKEYYDPCGFSNDWKYPSINFVINQSKDFSKRQTHLHFLRTKEGFKLIMVSL